MLVLPTPDQSAKIADTKTRIVASEDAVWRVWHGGQSNAWWWSSGANRRIKMKERPLLDADERLNQSTEPTLSALIGQINGFVQNAVLDSRCATKLVKRLKNEAEVIRGSGNSTKSGRRELKEAFDEVEATLREHDAGLLVAANAALRVKA
jgi:hypothetical protein